MHFPEPALMFWIIGPPLVLAIVDLFRTRSAIKNAPSTAGGPWSQALRVDQPGVLRSAALS